MKKDRFEHLCMEAQSGRDAFVHNPDCLEEGLVVGCDLRGGVMLVKTAESQIRNWYFDECDDLQHPKSGPMI